MQPIRSGRACAMGSAHEIAVNFLSACQWNIAHGIADRTFKLRSGLEPEYGRYVRTLRGAPRRASPLAGRGSGRGRNRELRSGCVAGIRGAGKEELKHAVAGLRALQAIDFCHRA